jgi:cobalt-zinc-cadmium efflux system outer membrane protein
LWGVGSDREKLGTATQKEAENFVALKRAEFIKNLALLYLNYKSSAMYEKLVNEEFFIAKKIADISQERYKAGTIARVKYLQAKVDLRGAKNNLAIKKAEKLSAYYLLLAFAGEKEDVIIGDDYSFSVNNTKQKISSSAELAYLQSKEQKNQKEAILSSNKIEWMNLYAEYEKEPQQSITRVGVDIPLALFNNKKEEKRIAELQSKQSKYLFENQKTVRSRKLIRLQKELDILREVFTSTQDLYSAQKELLAMYEDG